MLPKSRVWTRPRCFLVIIPSTDFPFGKTPEERRNTDDWSSKGMGEFTLADLGIGFASICLSFGTVLLFVAISQPSRDQTLAVIGGALLLSLGMVAVWRVMANKLKWWRAYKRYRERTD